MVPSSNFAILNNNLKFPKVSFGLQVNSKIFKTSDNVQVYDDDTATKLTQVTFIITVLSIFILLFFYIVFIM